MTSQSYLTPHELAIGVLDSQAAFNQLTQKEKLYAYYMYKASWAGAEIVQRQISDESPQIIKLFTDIFSENDPQESEYPVFYPAGPEG